MFSPPYGDGTESGKLTAYKKMFSPPYGDSTDITANNILFCKFSPPYGDNPLSHGLRRASSPERGSLVQGKWQLEKLFPRESWRAAPERVLRG